MKDISDVECKAHSSRPGPTFLASDNHIRGLCTKPAYCADAFLKVNNPFQKKQRLYMARS